MEKLARRMANNIARSLGYDNEREAVVAYGLIAILQISLTVLLVLLFGTLIGAPIEALIVCLSASILRKYSGGAHAVTAGLCTFISVVYCTVAALISKKLLLSLVPMLAADAIIFGLSFLIVYKYAPVDSPNKPIKKIQKINKMRKCSFITLSIYVILAFIWFVFRKKHVVFDSYSIALLFGVSWQVFTLTRYGSILLNKFNNLYNFFRKEAL